MNRVKCLECGARAAVLIGHILDKHKMSLVEYLEKHSKAAKGSQYLDLFATEQGWSALRGAIQGIGQRVGSRPKKTVRFLDVFPELALPSGDSEVDANAMIQVYEEPGALTPKANPRYRFPESVTVDVVNVILKKSRNSVWIKGPSGSGKTEFVKNLAARFNAELVIFNGDAFKQRSHLIGTKAAKSGETYFQYGPIVRAMQRGAWLLANEIDTLHPHTLNIFKPVLEDNPHIPVDENGEVVYAEEGFRIFSANNTWGYGDDTGQFSANVHPQSFADRRRWCCRVELDFMEPAAETLVLEGYFPCKNDADRAVLGKAVEFASKIREANKKGTLDFTLSTAELINWLENSLVSDRGVHHGARISFLTALPDDQRISAEATLVSVFGSEKTFTHHEPANESDDLPDDVSGGA